MELAEPLFLEHLAYHIYFCMYPFFDRERFLRVMRDSVTGYYYLRYCVKGKSSNNPRGKVVVFTCRSHSFYSESTVSIYRWPSREVFFQFETMIPFMLDMSWFNLYIMLGGRRISPTLALERVVPEVLYFSGCDRIVIPETYRKNIGDDFILASFLTYGFGNGTGSVSVDTSWFRDRCEIPSVTLDYCESFYRNCSELDRYLKTHTKSHDEKSIISISEVMDRVAPELIHHSSYRKEVRRYDK